MAGHQSGQRHTENECPGHHSPTPPWTARVSHIMFPFYKVLRVCSPKQAALRSPQALLARSRDEGPVSHEHVHLQE